MNTYTVDTFIDIIDTFINGNLSDFKKDIILLKENDKQESFINILQEFYPDQEKEILLYIFKNI